MGYKLIKGSDCVVRTDDMATIPNDPENSDRIKYMAWLQDGNTPEPADNPWPTLNKQIAAELLSQSDWTQMPDAGVANVKDFVNYRAQLRAIIKHPPEEQVSWPEKPVTEWKK